MCLFAYHIYLAALGKHYSNEWISTSLDSAMIKAGGYPWPVFTTNKWPFKSKRIPTQKSTRLVHATWSEVHTPSPVWDQHGQNYQLADSCPVMLYIMSLLFGSLSCERNNNKKGLLQDSFNHDKNRWLYTHHSLAPTVKRKTLLPLDTRLLVSAHDSYKLPCTGSADRTDNNLKTIKESRRQSQVIA